MPTNIKTPPSRTIPMEIGKIEVELALSVRSVTPRVPSFITTTWPGVPQLIVGVLPCPRTQKV
jgi:hypothetical protein